MSTSQSRTKTIVATAIGVGILAGAAGLAAYFGMEHAKRRRAFQHRINRLSKVSNENREDLDSEEEDKMSRCTNSTATEYVDCYSDVEALLDAFETASEKEEEEEEEKEALKKNKKLLTKVDKLLKGDDEERLKGFKLLEANEGNLSKDPEFLWRYAKAHQIQAIAHGLRRKENEKKEYILKGLKLASKSLELDPSDPDAHKWFAILTGMMGDYLPLAGKIEGAKTFYSHLGKAIQMKPNDYSLYHLLGRFKFEVANRSWMEKNLAKAIFGSFPDFTFSEAMENLLQAESLSPTPWIENRLFLGKCCMRQNLIDDAADWFGRALEVDARTLEESLLLDEANNLLEKCLH